MSSNDITAFFWDVATPFLLKDPAITKSTMMGFPCLRIDGQFFASAEPKTGDLITKLPKERVQELIDSEVGQIFAPNGRRFREWVLITSRDEAQWESLMQESEKFVATIAAKKKKK